MNPQDPVTATEPQPSRLAPWLLMAGLVGLWFIVGKAAVVMVLALAFMMFMHELGHYLTARSAGMTVTEFFLGFGPRIWSFRKGETEYGLKALPLGAHVRIPGMNNLDPLGWTPGSATSTFTSKSYARRMSVVLAGSGMHVLMAFVALLVLHAGIGWYAIGEDRAYVVPDDWTIANVQAGSSGEAMGLLVGDRILSAEGTDRPTFEQIKATVAGAPGQPISIEVLRDGATLALSGTIGIATGAGETTPRGLLGVSPTGTTLPPTRDSFGKAVASSASDVGQLSVASVSGIVDIPKWLVSQVFSGDPTGDGTVAAGANDATSAGNSSADDPLSVFGLVRFSGDIVDEGGWVGFLYLFATINIFIGLFNLVPLLPFDGGHAAIATYERLRTRRGAVPHRADVGKLLPLAYTTIAFLGVLTVFVLWSDLTRQSPF